MMNLGPADDPHRAIGSDVLAAKCVEHISVADSALPNATIPIVASSENVVFLSNDQLERTMLLVVFQSKKTSVFQRNTLLAGSAMFPL